MEILSLEAVQRESDAGNHAFSRFESIPAGMRARLLLGDG